MHSTSTSNSGDLNLQRPVYYPVSLDLRKRLVVVVGRGAVAVEKVEGLIEAGARIRLVGRDLEPALTRLLAEHPTIEHVDRDYLEGDLDGAFLVFAERDLDIDLEALFDAAERRHIFANVQDVVPWCSVIASSIVKQGDLSIAISTSGSAPALSVRLRQRMEKEFGPHYAQFLDLARRLRAPLKEHFPDFEERKRRWYELVDSDVLELFESGEVKLANERASAIMGVEPLSEDESQAPSP